MPVRRAKTTSPFFRFGDERLTPEERAVSDKAMAPYHGAIGQVASAWSHLEQVMDDTIWTLARVDHDRGACITAQFGSVYQRFDALLALVELLEGSAGLISQLNRLRQKSNGLGQKRNRVFHDLLIYVDQTHSPF